MFDSTTSNSLRFCYKLLAFGPRLSCVDCCRRYLVKRLLYPVVALLILGGVLGLTMALDKKISAPKADRDETVRGDTEFALDLYGQLKSQDGNLFFSPNSISTALAMTYGGAKGDTATQMASVLHFTLPIDRLNA